MKLIKRNEYLERLISVIGTPDIKVLTGIRRSGKSKLLEALKEYISENINDANIIHINFNIPIYEDLMEYHNLYNYIEERYINNKKAILPDNSFSVIGQNDFFTSYYLSIWHM